MVSLTAGVALLTVLAHYLGRRKISRPVRRTRKVGGRRTRNSMRSPNGNYPSHRVGSPHSIAHSMVFIFRLADIISLAGSKASARSISPGGSVVAFSDRLSLASGSLPAGVIEETSLSPQQLGVMGMEALETVINFWEDALVAYHTPTTAEESEFCREIQNLLDIAWQLQDQSELLFLDQRSVLFRAESVASEQRQLQRSMSDPNFDSAESFASALDQVGISFHQWYPKSLLAKMFPNRLQIFESSKISPIRCLIWRTIRCIRTPSSI